jgi:hypothetical protein
MHFRASSSSRSKSPSAFGSVAALLGALLLHRTFFFYLAAAHHEGGVEISVDCAGLMADFPNCTGMMYTVCSDGTPSACGAVASAMEAVSTTTNMTNATNMDDTGTTDAETACDVFMCFENGTYVMHDKHYTHGASGAGAAATMTTSMMLALAVAGLSLVITGLS